MREEERLVPKIANQHQSKDRIASAFHKPSQYLPLSPREHLQLRQKRGGARRLREFAQRASAFVVASADVGDRTSLLGQTWTVVWLRGWGMCEVEEMVCDVVPRGTGRAPLSKVLGRRQASRPFVQRPPASEQNDTVKRLVYLRVGLVDGGNHGGRVVLVVRDCMQDRGDFGSGDRVQT